MFAFMPAKLQKSRNRYAILPVMAGLLFTAAAPFSAGQSGNAPIVIDGHTTILCGAQVPGPVREAANDLANDLEKVLGTRPRIVAREEDAGASTILIGLQADIPETLRQPQPGGPESFSISAGRSKSGMSEIVLSGPDMRGTMYAVYQFSEDYVGVDPMYYWTDKEPARRDRIQIPASLDKVFPAPAFHYRGFFLNDEDLLTGWAPGDKDKSGIALDVMNKVYETILRLKGNIVVPGSWIFPDDPQVKLAGKRGLILNQHHATPLGVNVARWPKDVVYNYTTHPEILERAWKNSVAAYGDQEVLWTVGLRGLSDVTYAAMDPSVNGNDKALGELIGKAIADQMRIVRAAHPDAKFITDLWSEGAKLAQDGYLKLPSDAIPVWADNGYGFPQDKGKVASGQGVYYHVAMMNSRSNQLTEMVPVDRIVRELGRFSKAGATQFVLVNTSDLRPVLMTAKAAMEIAWHGSLPGGGDAADGYYRQWATDEFGEKAALALAEIYREYFAAPVHFGPEPLEYGDQLYHQEAVQMMQIYMTDAPLYFVPGQAPKWDPPRLQGVPGKGSQKDWVRATAAREAKLCAEAQPRWDAVWDKAVKAEALVDPARKPFYHAQVLAMIAINRESNRILTLVSEAILANDKGQKEQAHAALTQALGAFDALHDAEAKAEYGKWKNWYRGDWLTNVNSTQEFVKLFAKYVDDPSIDIPLPIFPRDWQAYYHIMHYQGDRTVDVR